MINELIERDELLKPKLTIAVDRITLKIPSLFTQTERKRIIQFKDNITKTVGKVEQTLRGVFGTKEDEYYIYLEIQSGSKKNRKRITKFKIFEGHYQ